MTEKSESCCKPCDCHCHVPKFEPRYVPWYPYVYPSTTTNPYIYPFIVNTDTTAPNTNKYTVWN